MKFWFCLMLTLLVLTTAVADERTAALDGEKKLDKPVTLTLRAASLKEVLAAVEKETGAHLLVQRDIAEDKATVCVKDQPAREVLRALAHCFNLCWSPSPTTEKQYLRLWMDRGYIASMHQSEYQDYLALLSQYQKELQPTAEMVRSGQEFHPSEELLMKTDKEDIPEHHRLDRRAEATASPAQGAVVLQYLALSDKQREQIQSGEHVVISGANISPDAHKVWPEGQSFDFATERSTSGYMLRCAIKPGDVRSNFLVSSAYFDDTPYKKEAEQTAARLTADPELAKALPADWKPATAVSIRLGEGSGAAPGTMNDGLLELAQATGIQIVSQYISEYSGASADWKKGAVTLPTSSAKTIGERLAELVKQHTFTMARDGQFLLGKCLLWHRMRLREVPEAKIRCWQRQSGGLSEAAFDTYVDMARMSWEQKRGIIECTKYWIGAMDMIYLARCEYPLRIYGSLTAEQKKWVDSGEPLPVSALTPEQQVDFMSAYEVRERPTFQNATDRNWPETAFFSLQSPGYDPSLCATAGMKAVAAAYPESASFQIPKGTPEEDREKIWRQRMEAQGPLVHKKLLDQLAKDHPEVSAKDVSIFGYHFYVFGLKLGEESHTANLPCMVRTQ